MQSGGSLKVERGSRRSQSGVVWVGFDLPWLALQLEEGHHKPKDEGMLET